MMQLEGYLKRIGYSGDLKPDLATLNAVHRGHLLSISYENLDIHRDCPLTVDLQQIYDKIVSRRRGGWCFEMNGLLAWALREIGFDVTLLSSFVGRSEALEAGPGDHLILLVKLEKDYLADVGFGNGFLEPLPLEEGIIQRNFFTYGLRQRDGRWWFQNQAYGGPGFDFDLQPYQLEEFAEQSTRLQTSPESGFVKNTVCLRFILEGLISLRGVVFRTITDQGPHDELIETETHYAGVLQEQFDLVIPNITPLWEKVQARHITWLREQQ